MARGNEREKARAANLAKEAKKGKTGGGTGANKGAANKDGDALQAKLAAKAKAKADGVPFGKDAKKAKDKGPGTKVADGSVKKSGKVQNAVNPHTGKRDAKFNAKREAKGKA
jgi:hypothetical protein